MAAAVGTVPRSSPSATSAHQRRPRISDTRAVEEVAFLPSELRVTYCLKSRQVSVRDRYTAKLIYFY